MNCLNMENPKKSQEWYGVNEHRFCTVLEVKNGKIIWPFFEYHPELWECHPEWWPVKKPETTRKCSVLDGALGTR